MRNPAVFSLRSFLLISLCCGFGLRWRSQHDKSPALRMESEKFPVSPVSVESKRRKHQNKYSQFSKTAAVDPVEEAIQRSAQLSGSSSEEVRYDLGQLKRGTTLPTLPSNNDTQGPTPSLEKTNFTAMNSINPSDPYTFGFVQIGTIINAHGIKGEVKALFDTDFVDFRVQVNNVIYIKKPNRLTPRPVKIQSCRKQVNNVYLLQLESIRSRLTALYFKSYKIYIKESNRPKLNLDEYLVRDLVGMRCYTVLRSDASMTKRTPGLKLKDRLKQRSEGQSDREIPKSFVGSIDSENGLTGMSKEYVGTVVGVVPPDELCEGANAALMHSMLEVRLIRPDRSERLCLVPFVPAIALIVDLETRSILLDPPKGLFDITYDPPEAKIVLRGFLPARSSYLKDEDRQYINANMKVIYSTNS